MKREPNHTDSIKITPLQLAHDAPDPPIARQPRPKHIAEERLTEDRAAEARLEDPERWDGLS